MNPKLPKDNDITAEEARSAQRESRIRPAGGGWPATWNWGVERRAEPRPWAEPQPRAEPQRGALRDLHGDYSEQTGAFFG